MSLNRLLTRRVRRAALALCAAAVLSACGGGDRAEPFVPGRIVAFGDELSMLDDSTSAGNALKYSVNGFNATNTTQRDCAVNPLWIQAVASHFSMGFTQCSSGFTNLNAFTRATVGATVADVQTSVTAFLSDTARAPAANDLVTILVGSHDVLNAFKDWDKAGRTDAARAAALDKVKAQAQLLAAQVKRLVDAGPAVLISTIPYLGASPYATAQGDVGKQLLLDLVDMFNNALQSSGSGNEPYTGPGLASFGFSGRDFGLIQIGTSWMKTIATSTDGTVQGYNARAMCPSTVQLPNCTTTDVTNNGGDVSTWVWADDTRPGVVFQNQLAARAVVMVGASGLPF
jgi:hypothetical protein